MKKVINSGSSKVFLINNNIVKKVFKKNNHLAKMKSEISSLKKLSSFDISPKILKVDFKKRTIHLENVGQNISKSNKPKNWRAQLLKILMILKKQGISHRDLKLEEILVKKKKIRIIDFGSSKIKKSFNSYEPYDETKSRYSKDIFIINLLDFYFNEKKFKGEIHTLVIWGQNNLTNEMISLLPKEIKIIYSYFYNKSYFGRFGFFKRISFLKKFYSNRDLFFGNKAKKGFHLYVLFDRNPIYNIRKNQFTNEESYVNKNLFDLKNNIRKGRVGFIHASDNLTESFDNIKALTPYWGKYPRALWDFSVPNFNSFADFFKKLNSEKKLNYVVLRGFDPHKMKMIDEDIDILVNDAHLFEKITKAIYYKHLNESKSYFAPSVNTGGYKVGAKILIGNKKIKFDIRRIGDNYFHEKWQKNMLKKFVSIKNIKFLNIENEFFSTIYHEVVHKAFFRASTLKKLFHQKSKLKLNYYNNQSEISFLKKELMKFMKKSNYEFVCPKELSLGCACKQTINSKILKNKPISHYNELLLSLKTTNWSSIKDLSLRNIRNNSYLKSIFYFFYYISRFVLILRKLGLIKIKFIMIYFWLNIKNFFYGKI